VSFYGEVGQNIGYSFLTFRYAIENVTLALGLCPGAATFFMEIPMIFFSYSENGFYVISSIIDFNNLTLI